MYQNILVVALDSLRTNVSYFDRKEIIKKKEKMSASGKSLLGLWLYRSGEQEWAVKQGSPLHGQRPNNKESAGNTTSLVRKCILGFIKLCTL